MIEKRDFISFPLACFMDIPRASLTLKEWQALSNILRFSYENGGKLWTKAGDPLPDEAFAALLGVDSNTSETLLDKFFELGFLCADDEGVSFSFPLCSHLIKETAAKREKVETPPPGTAMPSDRVDAVKMMKGAGVPSDFVREIAYPKAVESGWKINGVKIKNFPAFVKEFYRCHTYKRARAESV